MLWDVEIAYGRRLCALFSMLFVIVDTLVIKIAVCCLYVDGVIVLFSLI